MEKKVSYEPGHHASISRPTSPVQSVTLDSSIVECDAAESKCVLLETKVPQSSKVMLADSDHSVAKLDATATATSARTQEDTPVVLSGKMKLSLVKLDDIEKKSTDDVVVRAKDGSSQDKKPSRFGPNEE
uniref:(northern house mosquito) hypothetical protein n=2 Tax=Culex pipiens TaxID=7175 RepID=A0A8D8ETU1_CULPI